MRPIIILLNILLISSVYSQDLTIEKLQKEYMAFNYENVIKLAGEMLSQKKFSSDQLIQIYQMKGIAYFSLGDEESAKESFIKLLEEDSNYSMNPNQISPKIISFFNETKVNFQAEIEQDKPLIDSLKIVRENLTAEYMNYKSAVVKNLILPGWGQFQLGNSTKGIIYSVLSVASVASTIALIVDTNKKENAYLNENNKSLIVGKYDQYNSSFKTRNLLIATTALIWIASQVDILFFSNEYVGNTRSFSGQPIGSVSDIQINLSFPLN